MVLGYRPTWACPAPVHRASTTPIGAQAASTPSSSTAAGGSCPSGPPGLGHKLPDISFLPDDGVVSPPTSPPAPPTPGEEPPPAEVFQYTFSGHPQRASAPAVIHSKGEEPLTRRKSVAQQNAEYYAQQKRRPSGCDYRPSCAFPSMRSFVSNRVRVRHLSTRRARTRTLTLTLTLTLAQELGTVILCELLRQLPAAELQATAWPLLAPVVAGPLDEWPPHALLLGLELGKLLPHATMAALLPGVTLQGGALLCEP